MIKQIIQDLEGLLISEPHALARLEDHFKSLLIVLAGSEADVAKYAEQLRLAIVETERGTVLDYIQKQGLTKLTIDQVEEAINAVSLIDSSSLDPRAWEQPRPMWILLEPGLRRGKSSHPTPRSYKERSIWEIPVKAEIASWEQAAIQELMDKIVSC